MKKYILTIVLLLGMSMTVFADSVIYLEHEGGMTTFKAENINDALEAAANGDVLYLSEGTYPGFTITKQISIKGVGQLTIINGDIEINNPDKEKLTGIFIGYLDMKKFIVSSPIRGLKISQCQISSTDFYAITENSHLDRCNIENLNVGESYDKTVTIDDVTNTYTYPYIKGLTVTNSVIRFYFQKNQLVFSNVSLVNSFIKFISIIAGSFSYLYGTVFENSIISSIRDKNNNYYNKLKFVNSSIALNGTDIGDSEMIDCYDEAIEDYSVENLTQKNYFGTDGTVIGPYGGNTPYTLVPAVPRVTKSEIKIDPKKQEMNATLTVTPK